MAVKWVWVKLLRVPRDTPLCFFYITHCLTHTQLSGLHSDVTNQIMVYIWAPAPKTILLYCVSSYVRLVYCDDSARDVSRQIVRTLTTKTSKMYGK